MLFRSGITKELEEVLKKFFKQSQTVKWFVN